MNSLEVANYLIARYGQQIYFTNMKLNKLVYFMQVESLKYDGKPLFTDTIQAWDYGPVEPEVYRAFKDLGSGLIQSPRGKYPVTPKLEIVAKRVINEYGSLTAFDLMRLSHRRNGAWSKNYTKGANNTISIESILDSEDMNGFSRNGTLAAGIDYVDQKWPNALRMLENT